MGWLDDGFELVGGEFEFLEGERGDETLRCVAVGDGVEDAGVDGDGFGSGVGELGEQARGGVAGEEIFAVEEFTRDDFVAPAGICHRLNRHAQ